ncbi:MAG: YlxR family protein [Eubacterium sp.]|nr:YlxR family protein [Eubacterium sp.]
MNKKIPMRQCIGCREMKPKRELIRILKNKQQELSVDRTGKKNGRGAYICPSMDCFHLAIKQKGLERSFQMSIPPEFYTVFQKEMEDIGTE